MTLYRTVLHFPLFSIVALDDGEKLYSLNFLDQEKSIKRDFDSLLRYGEGTLIVSEHENTPLEHLLKSWFKRYCQKDFNHLPSIPLEPVGTPFQKEVWNYMLTIPAGETRSYLAVATALGSPLKARAVGNAAKRNPITVIIPCHRIIGMSGMLIGFAGGLDLKAKLLTHEGFSDFKS